MKVLVAHIGEPEVIDHSIALVHLAEIHCIDVKLDNSGRINMVRPRLMA